jgi:hypothetical protein
MGGRLAAARAAGIRTVFAPVGTEGVEGLRIVPVRRVNNALTWAGVGEGGRSGRRSA